MITLWIIFQAGEKRTAARVNNQFIGDTLMNNNIDGFAIR
jgi:hypothetical protein